MDYCGTEIFQPTSQFKMADRFNQLPLGVALVYFTYLLMKSSQTNRKSKFIHYTDLMYEGY